MHKHDLYIKMDLGWHIESAFTAAVTGDVGLATLQAKVLACMPDEGVRRDPAEVLNGLVLVEASSCYKFSSRIAQALWQGRAAPLVWASEFRGDWVSVPSGGARLARVLTTPTQVVLEMLAPQTVRRGVCGPTSRPRPRHHRGWGIRYGPATGGGGIGVAR